MQISNKTSSSFNVTWSSHGSNVASYHLEIYRGSETPSNLVYRFNLGSGARSYYVGGLTASTYYVVKLFSRTSANVTVDIERAYPTTESPPQPSPTQPSVNWTASQSYLYINWSASYADYYAYELRTMGGSIVDSNYTYYNTSVDIGGLSAGTSYKFKVYGRNSSGNGTYTEITMYTDSISPPSTPTGFYAQNSEGSTSVVVYWNTVSSADSYTLRAYNASTGYQVGSTVSGVSWNTDRYTFSSGMSLGNSYYFRIWAVNGGGESGYAQTQTITLGYARPTEFSWDSSKNSGYNFNLTASEWKKLHTKINQFRKYKYPSYTDISFIYVDRGYEFEARHFNQVRDAIDFLSPRTSAPSQQNKGGTVYASDLDRLVSSLNSVTR